MAESRLMLHCGAVPITRTELARYQAPEPVGRWFPLSHSRVLDVTTSALNDAGFRVQKESLGVMRDGSRFFGTLDLASPLAEGVSLAVGIRNSVDKSFPLGFCAGSRVFTCDNLAFRSDLLICRKHTRHGERDFSRSIAESVVKLDLFRAEEANRIDRMRTTPIGEETADSVILRSFERGIISTRELPLVLHAWRNPSHLEFQPRTVWSLLNAFTNALKTQQERMPQRHAVTTIRLNALLLDPERN